MKLTRTIVENLQSVYLQAKYDEPADVPNFHRQMWELVCSDAPDVVIAAPRHHAKSTSITLAYALAVLLFRVRDFMLLVSDTEDQAKKFLHDIKVELQENDQLIADFGVSEFVTESQTELEVKFQDGYRFHVICKGSEQRVRGLKWRNKRPNVILCHRIGTWIYTPETGWIENQNHPDSKVVTAKSGYRVEFEDGSTEIVSEEHRYLTEEGWSHVSQMKSGQSVVESLSDDTTTSLKPRLNEQSGFPRTLTVMLPPKQRIISVTAMRFWKKLNSLLGTTPRGNEHKFKRGGLPSNGRPQLG